MELDKFTWSIPPHLWNDHLTWDVGRVNVSTSYFGRIGIKLNVSNAMFYIHIFDY
jgi:hypothetical protein